MEEPPIDRLLREKEDEAIEKDEEELVFLSPDRNTSSKLVVNRYEKTLSIETTLFHSVRMIDENIYLASEILSDKFTEDQIRDIIDDISARLRMIELPELMKNIQYDFKIVHKDEEYTKFARQLSYDKEELTYETLRDEFETILMNSFELIYNFLVKIGFFIQTNLSQFLVQPIIEMKLLEIRKLLFQAQFYATMTGRFAGDQRRISQSMRKDALELISTFEKEFPDLASDRLKEIRNYFNLKNP